jgi:hypothetical protein
MVSFNSTVSFHVTKSTKQSISEKLVVLHLASPVFGTERFSTVFTIAAREPYPELGESSPEIITITIIIIGTTYHCYCCC